MGDASYHSVQNPIDSSIP